LTNTKGRPDKEQRVQIKTRQPGPVSPSGFSQLRRHADLDSVDTVAEILSLSVEAPAHSDETPGRIPAPGTQDALGGQFAPGTLPAGGSSDTLRSETAPGRASAPGEIVAPGILPAPGRVSAPRRNAAPGSKTASAKHVVIPAGDISPRRDFTKTPNSILRDVLSRGLFRGKSRDIYDYLYSRTRGAIMPRRSALLTSTEIMRGANIGSDHTLRDNLRHLMLVGLIDRKVNSGAQDGNEYFVFLPEEVNLPFDREGNPLQLSSPPQAISPGHPGQELPGAPGAESAGGAPGSSADSTTTSDEPKTSFKTKEEKLDDEALARFAAAMKKASLDVIGKGLTPTDAERWGELAELLVTELKIAAGRTGSVSSVPAFLTEHLRRRLWKTDKRQVEEEGKSGVGSQGSAVSLDFSQCPDCFGTGMYYPEGFDKGVAKCGHENMTKE
jgi:hypothetical protein